ncbi:MAG: hypothetical protein IIB76_05285, partial [Proteobacteria bacterium]|nr:hypothetical protein [Pseudomonadota bacterium]
MFENPEISEDELPRVSTVHWLGMDRQFLRFLLVQSALAVIFLSIGIGVLQQIFNIAFAEENINLKLGMLWFLIPIIAVPTFIWPLISVPRKGYAVRAKDIM